MTAATHQNDIFAGRIAYIASMMSSAVRLKLSAVRVQGSSYQRQYHGQWFVHAVKRPNNCLAS